MIGSPPVLKASGVRTVVLNCGWGGRCFDVGEERVRHVDSLSTLLANRRDQFVDLRARFEIDIPKHLAKFLQNRLGFEHGEVLLALLVFVFGWRATR